MPLIILIIGMYILNNKTVKKLDIKKIAIIKYFIYLTLLKSSSN